MKNSIEIFRKSMRALTKEKSYSFYIFFTTILSDYATLWVNDRNNILLFTILTISYLVNIIICSFLKKKWKNTKKELIISRIYIIIFVVISIIGGIIKFNSIIALILLPIIFTYVCIINDDVFVGKVRIIFITMVYLIFLLSVLSTNMPLSIKIVIIVGYIIISPLIAYLEKTASESIFGIGFDISYNH